MAGSGADIFEDGDFDTVLSQGIDFTGTVQFEDPLLIRGRVSGNIESGGLLVVDEGAVVDADIRTSRVVIRGRVTGNIVASEKAEIAGSGRLDGDLATPEIFMEAGCVFNGTCSMTSRP